jgi:hypothetical protein
MTPAYFAGEAAHLGRVSRLPVSTFAELVSDVIRQPAPIAMTREQLLSLPEKEQNAAKRTRYIVPCSFRESPSQRVTSQATEAHLLCLDIDDSGEAARLLNAGLATVLGELNAAVWHTARSTEAKPRLRVVVPCVPVPIQRYGTAVTAIAGVLGLNTVTRESQVPVQPMYLPIAYQGDDRDPVAYSKVDGDLFDPSTLEGLEELRAPVSADDADVGDLVYLRAPVDGITREEIAEALTHLPAACSMQDWIEVGMALKHQFGESGFTLWDDWSATAPEKYPGMDELAGRWESFRAQPADRVPVTIRSVIAGAVEAGWNNRPMATRMFESARAWIRDASRSSEELLDQGAKRLAKLASVVGPIESKVLIADLHATVRSRGLRGPTQQDIAKEVKRLSTAATRSASQQPPWAGNIVFLTAPNLFYRPIDGRKLKREVVDLIYRSPVQEVSTCDYLIHDVGVPVVENLRYAPGEKKRVFTDGGVPYINTYRPSYAKADRALKQAAMDLWMLHVTNLCGKHVRLLTNKFAHMVQHPGHKVRWGTFILGAQGCGKGWVALSGEYVLGASNVQILSAEYALEATHNGWASGSLLTIINEIRMFGANRYKMGDKLKPLISDDRISVRNLYEPVQTVPNVTNYLMFSNWHDAIAVQAGERRYCCIASPLQTREQVLALGPTYFTHIYSELARLAGGLRAFFEDWTIDSDFNPGGRAPHTEYLDEMMRLTTTPLHRAVLDAVEDAAHPLVRPDLVSLTCLRALMPREGLPPFSDQGLASILRQEGFVDCGRHSIDGNRHSLWARGKPERALDTARTRLELL